MHGDDSCNDEGFLKTKGNFNREPDLIRPTQKISLRCYSAQGTRIFRSRLTLHLRYHMQDNSHTDYSNRDTVKLEIINTVLHNILTEIDTLEKST